MRPSKTIILFLFLITGCDREDAHDIFKTRGAPVVEYFLLSDFNGIDVNNGINVVLTQGSVNDATIVGWKNLMPKVHLAVDSDGVLMIEDKNKFNFVRSRDNMTTVHLTFANELNAISLSGNGYIVSNDTINTTYLSILCLNGSGDVDLKLKTEALTIGTNNANIASITVTGSANSVGMTNWGYNPVFLEGLTVSSANIHHHGLSNVYVNVLESLNVVLYGVGNVYYTGSPSISLTRKGKGNLLIKDD